MHKSATLTSYQSLLVEYTPRPIRTETQYKKALKTLARLMRPNLPRAESELVELLGTMVEQYEAQRHPTPTMEPRDKLAALIEVRGLAKAELARATGIARSTITEVLSGDRAISKRNAARLAKFFDEPIESFIETE